MYTASEAAFGRAQGGIETQFKDQGVRAFNVDPGNVITEKRRLQHPDDDFESGLGPAPAAATGATIAWLASTDNSAALRRQVDLHRRSSAPIAGLLPGWPPEGVTP